MQKKRLSGLIASALLALTAGTQGATSNFSTFTPLPNSVAAGALPETAPFQFGDATWRQLSIADRATQLGLGQVPSPSDAGRPCRPLAPSPPDFISTTSTRTSRS